MSSDKCLRPGCIRDPGASGYCSKCEGSVGYNKPAETYTHGTPKPTAVEQRLYDLQPRFVQRCLELRAQAPCDMSAVLTPAAVWERRAELQVTREGPVIEYSDGTKKRFDELAAAGRLHVLAQAEVVFQRLQRAIAHADKLLSAAERFLLHGLAGDETNDDAADL